MQLASASMSHVPFGLGQRQRVDENADGGCWIKIVESLDKRLDRKRCFQATALSALMVG